MSKTLWHDDIRAAVQYSTRVAIKLSAKAIAAVRRSAKLLVAVGLSTEALAGVKLHAKKTSGSQAQY